MFKAYLLTVILLLLSLTACGDGSTEAPFINAGEDLAIETSDITVSINAEITDSTRTIVSIQWEQISGVNVQLIDADKLTPSFTIPDIMQDVILEFKVTVIDDEGEISSDLITITLIYSYNSLPEVNAGDDQTVDENTLVTLTGSATDSDGIITLYRWEQTAGSNVTLTDADTATVSFTAPDITSSETLTFTLTVTDDKGTTNSDLINVIVELVTPDNNAPVITIANTLITNEDSAKALTFTFIDADGDTVTATQKIMPAHGTIGITGTTIIYTPTVDYNGADEFTLTLTDGNGYSVNKTIVVTVNSVNDDPVITLASSLTTNEDRSANLSFTFTDVDGDTVTATEKTVPTNGNVGISGTTITYTPTADYNGADEFILTLTDGKGFSVDKTITVTVNSVNDDPVITLASSLTTNEDRSANLSFTFTDADGDTVTAAQKTAPTNGVISISGTTITYIPTTDYNGADEFVLTLTDGKGYSVNKTIAVTVNSVNDDPVITLANSLTTNEDRSANLSFTFTDADGDTVTAAQKTVPTNGVISISGTTITYTPTADYNGADEFVLTLTDGNGYSVNKTIAVTVNSVNDESVIIIASSLSTDEDIPTNLIFTFTDVDGDTVTASEKTAPAHGTIGISGTTITYTPTLNYNGADEFTLTLTDGKGYSVDKSIAVTVNSVNDEPTVNAGDDITVVTPVPVTIVNFNAKASDVDGTIASILWEQINITDVTVSLIDNTSVTASFTIPDISEGKTLEFKIIATNDEGVTSSDVITVNLIKASLNDTGLTWDGSYPSGNNTICGTGVNSDEQDCAHGRDALATQDSLTKIGGGEAGFDFTKLDSEGVPLSIQSGIWDDTGDASNGTKWSCVKDNHTGLMWEVKTNDTGLRDASYTYTWFDTNTETNGGDDGTANGGICYDAVNCDTEKYTALINALDSGSGICGKNDWRIPSKGELRSIVSYGKTNLAIDGDYFPNTALDYYWSSSANASSSGNAWLVYFRDGNDDYFYDRSHSSRVRLVRSGQ